MRARFVPWDWLGDHLAVDFANTVRRDGAEYVELLRSGEDLAAWSEREHGRVPLADAGAAEARMDEVRALRDAVLAALRAAAEGRPPPQGAVARLDARLRATPVVAQLGGPPHVAGAPGPVDELLARAAHAAVELVASGAPLGFCDAPSCGPLFLRRRRTQRWCGHACGTRARVARHAARRARSRS
jgi:predicted RNA-binding Zn ribbon-like protein